MPPFRYPPRFHSVFSTVLRARRSSFARFYSDHHQLDEAGPLVCRLSSRSVLRLRGPDTVKFLQNFVTNDVRPLAADYHPASPYLPTPIYAAMLNPEGRFLYDIFLYRQPDPEVKLGRTGSKEPLTVLADVDATVSNELLEHFKKCRLRAKVDIENAAKEFFCWQQFGGNLSNKASSVQEPESASVGWGKEVARAGESAAQGNSIGWKWFKDPRLECLGFRGIFPSEIIPPMVESDKETKEQHYLLWRLEKGVAEGSTEIPKGEAIPLEFNLVGLNAISFDKGCYIGQELVARTHHRGVIRKRLLPFKFVDDTGKEIEQEVPQGSEVVSKNSNKKAGTVTTALGCQGMGLLRLEEVFKRSPTLSIKERDDVKVKVIRPDWWPAEWVPIHEQQTEAV